MEPTGKKTDEETAVQGSAEESAAVSQADGSSEDDGREDLENAQDAKDADDESSEVK